MGRLWIEDHIAGRMEEAKEKGPRKEGVTNLYYEWMVSLIKGPIISPCRYDYDAS